MIRIPKILGALLIVIPVVAIGFLIVGYLLFLPRYPAQPKFGFTGEWRVANVFGVEQRPLPPATNVWADYHSWTPRTNESSRLYLARLGGIRRQSNFRTSTVAGDTPLGARNYSSADFLYEDPTNGTYWLHWSLDGKHSTDFLRFDNHERLYQLEPFGESGAQPPKLRIVAIEGIAPPYP